MFLGTRTHQRVVISPQMSLAILQFLTTSVRAFFPEHCSQRTLRKLLNMDVYRQIKVSKSRKETNLMDDDIEDEFIIMKKGKPCDFFVLILEGRVEVVIGKEEHKFHEEEVEETEETVPISKRFWFICAKMCLFFSIGILVIIFTQV